MLLLHCNSQMNVWTSSIWSWLEVEPRVVSVSVQNPEYAVAPSETFSKRRRQREASKIAVKVYVFFLNVRTKTEGWKDSWEGALPTKARLCGRTAGRKKTKKKTNVVLAPVMSACCFMVRVNQTHLFLLSACSKWTLFFSRSFRQLLPFVFISNTSRLSASSMTLSWLCTFCGCYHWITGS